MHVHWGWVIVGVLLGFMLAPMIGGVLPLPQFGGASQAGM